MAYFKRVRKRLRESGYTDLTLLAQLQYSCGVKTTNLKENIIQYQHYLFTVIGKFDLNAALPVRKVFFFIVFTAIFTS